MGRCNQRSRKVENEPEVFWCGDSTKYILLAIFSAVASGPLLCITIHQVCVSKCLLRRRLPLLGRNADDLLLIVIFLFFTLFNFVTCCVLWSLLSKGTKYLFSEWLSFDRRTPEKPTLMDPKVTRSGRPYGYRKARYVASCTVARKRRK